MTRRTTSALLAAALAAFAPGAVADDGAPPVMRARLTERLIVRGASKRRGRFHLRVRGTTPTPPETSFSLRLGDVVIDLPLPRRPTRRFAPIGRGVRARVWTGGGRIAADVRGARTDDAGESALAERVLQDSFAQDWFEDDAAPHGLYSGEVVLDGVRTPLVVGVAGRLRTRYVGPFEVPRHSLSLAAAGLSLAQADAAPVVALVPSPGGAWTGRVRGFALARDAAPAMSIVRSASRVHALAARDSGGAFEVGEGTPVGEGVSVLSLPEGTVFQARFDSAVQTTPGAHALAVRAVDSAGRVGERTRAFETPAAAPPHFLDANGQVLEVREGGALWAWGSNMFGEVGDGTVRDPVSPVPLPEPAGVVAVAAGDMVSFAVDGTGQVWIWGWWDKEVLDGEGGGVSWSVGGPRPRLFPGLDEIVAVSAGMWDDGAHALDSRGVLWRLDEGTRPFDKHRVDGLPRIVAVSQAVSASLALDARGGVWQLDPAVLVDGLPPCRSISAGAWGACLALDEGGVVWSWSLGGADAPSRIDLPGVVTSISAGDGVHGALLEDGTAWTWANAAGDEYEEDEEDESESATPNRVRDLERLTLFSVGRGGTSIAVDADGATWTWSQYDASGSGGVGHEFPVLAPREFLPGHLPLATATLAARTPPSPRRR